MLYFNSTNGFYKYKFFFSSTEAHATKRQVFETKDNGQNSLRFYFCNWNGGHERG